MLFARRQLAARGQIAHRDAPIDRTERRSAERLAEIASRWEAVPAEVRAANLREDPDAFFRVQRDVLYAAGLIERAEALSRYLRLDPADRIALIERECLAIANPPVVVAGEVDVGPADISKAPVRRRRAP